MKSRLMSLWLVIALCAQMTAAQESTCVISGTILSEQTGQPLPGIVVIIHKVYKAKKLLRSVPQKFQTNSSGVFSFSLVRGAEAVIETQVEGYNVPGGVAVFIPDAASATLESLNRVTMREQVPVAVPTESGAPLDATFITRTPNGVLTGEQALSTLSTGLVKVTNGTGAVSTAGPGDLPVGIDAAKISGGTVSNAEFNTLDGAASPIQPQLDSLQTQINGKAALAHSHAGPDITSGLISPSRLGSGSPDATKILFGNGTWGAAPAATPGGLSGDIQVNISGSFAGSLLKQGTNTIEQRNGGNAQKLKVYSFFTDGSNYRGIQLDTAWAGSSGNMAVEAIGAGSGANPELWLVNDSGTGGITFRTGGSQSWRINPAGHFISINDNDRDIGAAGANRPRTGYFATSLISPKFEIAPGINWTSGAGSPEGVITASVGAIYSRNNGAAGTTFYVKETGTGNTGWAVVGGGGGGTSSYDIGGGINGLPDPNEYLMIFPAVRSTTLPASLTGAQGYAIAASTGSVSFTIYRRPSGTTTDNQLGTMVFSAGSRNATFTVTDATQLALSAGDILLVKAPGTQDATLANIGFVFKIN